MSRSRSAFAGVVACALVLSAFPAHGGDWRVTPRISTSVSYSDNVDLNTAGREEDVVFRVTPGVSIRGIGRRADVNINYSGSFLWFVDQNREQWRNSLESRIKLEPVRNTFFIDASAVIANPIVDQSQAFSFSNANFGFNRRQAMSYRVSPYVRHRLGQLADVEWRYNFRYVDIERPAVNDPMGEVIQDLVDHEARLRVDSGNRLGRFKWGITAVYESTNRRADDRRSEDIRATVDAEFKIVRWLGVIGTVGYERIEEADLVGLVDGVTWEAGIRLTPSRNTNLLVTYGRTDGDDHLTVKGTYKRKRLRFGIVYDEEITTSQRQFSDNVNDGIVNDQGVFVDEFGIPLNPDDAIFGFTNEAFRQKRLTFDVAYNHRLTRASLKTYYQRRIFRVSDSIANEFGGNFRIARDLNPQTSISSTLFYRHIDFDTGPSRVDNHYGARVALTRDFSQYLSGVLSYLYSRTDSNDTMFDRSENVVTISLQANF